MTESQSLQQFSFKKVLSKNIRKTKFEIRILFQMTESQSLQKFGFKKVISKKYEKRSLNKEIFFG
jgi:hypothetical protein